MAAAEEEFQRYTTSRAEALKDIELADFHGVFRHALNEFRRMVELSAGDELDVKRNATETVDRMWTEWVKENNCDGAIATSPPCDVDPRRPCATLYAVFMASIIHLSHRDNEERIRGLRQAIVSSCRFLHPFGFMEVERLEMPPRSS